MSKTIIPKAVVKTNVGSAGYIDIRGGIIALLSATRQAAARNVNALMTASYWENGRRIVEAEQKGNRRAGYGEQLIERLSVDLAQQFGRGFSARNLEQMRQFFVTWPIPHTLSAESQKAIPSSHGKKAQTASAQLSIAPVSGASFHKITIAELAQLFVLPWSAYVRLLSVNLRRYGHREPGRPNTLRLVRHSDCERANHCVEANSGQFFVSAFKQLFRGASVVFERGFNSSPDKTVKM
jgi:DUF1016 N-terminal domain